MSKGYQRGFINDRAVIDREWLVEHASGIIVLSGAKDGELGIALLKGNQAFAESITEFYKAHFPDRYLELGELIVQMKKIIFILRWPTANQLIFPWSQPTMSVF